MDPVIHLRRTKHYVFTMERRLKEYDLQSIISSKYEVGLKRVFLEQHLMIRLDILWNQAI